MVRKGWTKIEVPEGWTQINRGPRPPSAKWNHRRGSAFHQLLPKNVDDVKSPLEKPAATPGVCSSRCGRGCSAQESGETRGGFGHVGEDDDIFPAIRERLHESASASTSSASARTHPSLQVVFGENATGRGCPSNNCQGTGELGRGCCGAGETGSIFGGWRAEVESVSHRGEEQSFSFHCSTSSGGRWPGCGHRVDVGEAPRVAAGSGTGDAPDHHVLMTARPVTQVPPRDRHAGLEWRFVQKESWQQQEQLPRPRCCQIILGCTCSVSLNECEPHGCLC